jgi:TnpA family transposase
LARCKQLGKMRLYAPGFRTNQPWSAIAPVISARTIDWRLIAQLRRARQVRHSAELGTAEAQQLLRRFTRGGRTHPAHQALDELGRVRRTVFLCNLLADENVRREVHEARQVVETWNSGIDFILYGKDAELTGDDRESHINPDGTFHIDMSTHLDLGPATGHAEAA